MKRWFLIFIVGLLFVPALAAHNPAIDAAHRTTHVVTASPLVGPGSKCSGTAVGPHALLIASHCEEPVSTIDIDGTSAHIFGFTRDYRDHTIYFVSAEFTSWAEFADNSGAVGDDIFIFGNPGDNTDILRKGYVAHLPSGETQLAPVDFFMNPFAIAARLVRSNPQYITYDFNGWMGDSGAAIFNEQGKIVGVVSVGIINEPPEGHENWSPLKLIGGYSITFPPEILKQVREFTPKKP